MAHVLGFKVSPQGKSEYGDLFSTKLKTRVEVKARGDNNAIGMHTRQLDGYEWDLPQELRHTLYCLVPYRSRRQITEAEKLKYGFSPKTTMISMLRFCKTEESANKHWAENVDVVYLLDIRLINGLRDYLGVAMGHYAGRPDEEAVVVGRNTLTELFQDGTLSRSLKKLGLSPSGWAKGVYPIKTRYTYRYPLDQVDDQLSRFAEQRLSSEFTLITVVRRDLHAELASEINKRTIALV